MIATEFAKVDEMEPEELATAVDTYNGNHNMHALNIIENTSINSELREIMFREMEKGLPFDSSIVRDLEKLKQEFVALVNSNKKN